eukprot:Rhum_TRINITY_DN25414_c0_g1::Rhum_TRINITY_DN25414_c0_g1_i1::g.182076::m.182076
MQRTGATALLRAARHSASCSLQGAALQQQRWKAQPGAFEAMTERKTERVAELARRGEKLAEAELNADDELTDRLQGLQALARLEKQVPLTKAAAQNKAPVEVPLDEKPVASYVTLTAVRERTKGTTIRKEEMIYAYSKVPKPDDSQAVQIRSASGSQIIGYGYFKRDTLSVAVVLWVSFAKDELSPRVKKETNLVSMGLGRKFWFDRFFKALEFRQSVLDLDTVQMFTLINSDADGCPGVLVQMYNSFAKITVLDPVAINYLALLVEFIETRTPTTGLLVTGRTKAITKTIPFKYRKHPKKQDLVRKVTFDDLSFVIGLGTPLQEVSVGRRVVRGVLAPFVKGLRVAVLNDPNGVVSAGILADGAEKVCIANENPASLLQARKHIGMNFTKDEQRARVEPGQGKDKVTKAFVHHLPNVENRVSYVESKEQPFLRKVEKDAYDFFFLDLDWSSPEFSNPSVVTLVLVSAMRRVRIDAVKGGYIAIITRFDEAELTSIIRRAASANVFDVRLIAPLRPPPDSTKSVHTTSRPEFSGWLLNIRAA